MEKTMKIEGMMCGHCEARVKKCLEALPEVFSHVEEMKTVGLDVPQVTELVYELQKAGMPLDGHIISEDACVDAILKCMA